jgi:hypothetical protein
MWFIAFVIIFTICIIFLIFAPRKRTFYDYNDYFPELKSVCENDQYKSLLLQEIDESDWEDHPGEQFVSDNMSYKIIPVLMMGNWKHQEKYPQLATLAQNPKIRSLILAKIGKKTALKPHRLWGSLANTTMRVSIPLSIPSPNINKCGVWTKGDTRPLALTSMYDTSQLHSMFNSRVRPAIVLLIDLERPKKIRKGESTVKPPTHI